MKPLSVREDRVNIFNKVLAIVLALGLSVSFSTAYADDLESDGYTDYSEEDARILASGDEDSEQPIVDEPAIDEEPEQKVEKKPPVKKKKHKKKKHKKGKNHK